MASHFEDRGEIPTEEMEWPRKSREETPSTDFSTYLDAIVLEACEELAQVGEVGFLIRTGGEEVVNGEAEGKASHYLVNER